MNGGDDHHPVVVTEDDGPWLNRDPSDSYRIPLADGLHLAADVTGGSGSAEGGKAHVAQFVGVPHGPVYQCSHKAVPSSAGSGPLPEDGLVVMRRRHFNGDDRTAELPGGLDIRSLTPEQRAKLTDEEIAQLEEGRTLAERLRLLVDNFEAVSAEDFNRLVELQEDSAAQVLRRWIRAS